MRDSDKRIKASTCEIPSVGVGDEEILEIFGSSRTIAIVGLSHKPEKDSYKVAKYLLEQGFEVIPVNPIREEILGKRCYKSLLDIPGPVDIADLFLSQDRILGVVKQAIQKMVKAIWMQIGVVDNEAAKLALGQGIKVVMNLCIMREHHRLKDKL